MQDYAISCILIILSLGATIIGVCSQLETKHAAPQKKITSWAWFAMVLALLTAFFSLLKVNADTRSQKDLANKLRQSEIREIEARKMLRNQDRIVFSDTIRFGSGNPLFWDGPKRIPGGATIELQGFDIDLGISIRGIEQHDVKNSKDKPQFVHITGTPGEVAYEWRVFVNEKTREKGFFDSGTIKVISNYNLGEWSHTRDSEHEE